MCGLELPDLETSIWNRYRPQGLRVVGISPPISPIDVPDSLDDVRAFARHTAVTFPLGISVTSAWNDFHKGRDDSAAPFPMRVLIDRLGNVAYASSTIDPEGLRRAIERTLAPGP